MAASPFEPAGRVAAWPGAVECGGEESFDLADGERDETRIGGRRGARAGRRRGLVVGAVAELGGGDRTDGEGRHDQDKVAEDSGVVAGLALVQAEAALPELSSLPRPG